MRDHQTLSSSLLQSPQHGNGFRRVHNDRNGLGARTTGRAPQWLDFEHAFNQAYPGSHEVLTKAGRATNQYWPAESLPNVVTIGAGLEVFAVPALVMVSRPLAVHVARKHASQSHACAGIDYSNVDVA